MSGSLDEVSWKLGELNGRLDTLISNQEHLITWMKDSNSKLNDTLTKHTEADAANFNSLSVKVESLDKWKSKVITVASVCSLIVGAGFQTALAFIQRGK